LPLNPPRFRLAVPERRFVISGAVCAKVLQALAYMNFAFCVRLIGDNSRARYMIDQFPVAFDLSL